MLDFKTCLQCAMDAGNVKHEDGFVHLLSKVEHNVVRFSIDDARKMWEQNAVLLLCVARIDDDNSSASFFISPKNKPPVTCEFLMTHLMKESGDA